MPWKALEEVVKVLEFGDRKYTKLDANGNVVERGANNWKKVDPELYKDALVRHALSYVAGEKVDPDSGLPALAHLICDALFLIWFDLREGQSSPSPAVETIQVTKDLKPGDRVQEIGRSEVGVVLMINENRLHPACTQVAVRWPDGVRSVRVPSELVYVGPE